MALHQYYSAPFSQELPSFGTSCREIDDPMEGVEYHPTIVIDDRMDGVEYQNGTSVHIQVADSFINGGEMDGVVSQTLQQSQAPSGETEPFPELPKSYDAIDAALGVLLEQVPTKQKQPANADNGNHKNGHPKKGRKRSGNRPSEPMDQSPAQYQGFSGGRTRR